MWAVKFSPVVSIRHKSSVRVLFVVFLLRIKKFNAKVLVKILPARATFCTPWLFFSRVKMSRFHLSLPFDWHMQPWSRSGYPWKFLCIPSSWTNPTTISGPFSWVTKAPYKDDLRDILFLIEILLVLPLSATKCERATSAQNRIKNSHRASLASQTTEDLIQFQQKVLLTMSLILLQP